MKVTDQINFVLGGIVACLTFAFGEHWTLFGVFLILNIADWITGWMKSRLAKKENSQKGWTGVLKKLGYWGMIFIAFMSSKWFVEIGEVLGIDLHITTLLGWFVLASLTVNELRSVLENFVEAGYKLPKVLVDGLEVADKIINDEEEKEKK